MSGLWGCGRWRQRRKQKAREHTGQSYKALEISRVLECLESWSLVVVGRTFPTNDVGLARALSSIRS